MALKRETSSAVWRIALLCQRAPGQRFKETEAAQLEGEVVAETMITADVLTPHIN
jgi:hypothetical protein